MNYDKDAEEVRSRINQLLGAKKITQNAVADGSTPAQKRLNSQLSHGANISLDTILRVISACPDVSLDWLLRGKGDMVINAATAATGAQEVSGQNATVIGQQVGTLSEAFVCGLLAEKDKQIETLLKLLAK